MEQLKDMILLIIFYHKFKIQTKQKFSSLLIFNNIRFFFDLPVVDYSPVKVLFYDKHRTILEKK